MNVNEIIQELKYFYSVILVLLLKSLKSSSTLITSPFQIVLLVNPLLPLLDKKASYNHHHHLADGAQAVGCVWGKLALAPRCEGPSNAACSFNYYCGL